MKAVSQRDGRLYGYVLMPNHFHMVVWVEGGGPILSDMVRDIKSLSSRMMFPDRHGIWMPRFDDVALYSEKQLSVKLAYMHNNPVRAGLVCRPEDYQYSSAREWSTGETSPFVDPRL